MASKHCVNPLVEVVCRMNAALGIKRHCPACQAKFYDMQRSPVLCPKCNYEFAEAKPKNVHVIPEVVPPKKIIKDIELDDDEETELKQMGGVVELEDLNEFDDDGDVEHLEEVEEHHEELEVDPNSDDAEDEMFVGEVSEFEEDIVDDTDDDLEEVDFR